MRGTDSTIPSKVMILTTLSRPSSSPAPLTSPWLKTRLRAPITSPCWFVLQIYIAMDCHLQNHHCHHLPFTRSPFDIQSPCHQHNLVGSPGTRCDGLRPSESPLSLPAALRYAVPHVRSIPTRGTFRSFNSASSMTTNHFPIPLANLPVKFRHQFAMPQDSFSMLSPPPFNVERRHRRPVTLAV